MTAGVAFKTILYRDPIAWPAKRRRGVESYVHGLHMDYRS